MNAAAPQVEVLTDLLAGLGWVVAGGSLLLHTLTLVLAVVAVADLAGYRRRMDYAVYHEDFGDPLARGVSLLLPLGAARGDPVGAVRSLLALRYPDFEVVLVDDDPGDADGGLCALVEAFDLVETPLVVPHRVPYSGDVVRTLSARSGAHRLVVVVKAPGSEADALNAGLDVARKELVGQVGPGVVLDPEALFHVAKPFADDPEAVVAAGGVVLGLNGCTVREGRVVATSPARSWRARVQAVEHLREYLLLRGAWSALGGLAQVSTAFSLARRDLVVAVRGWRPASWDEDADLVLRLVQRRRDTLGTARAVLVSEPVAWVEVPETRAGLALLRLRRRRGLAACLARHADMFLRPRYGVTGLLALPWLAVMSVVGPALELGLAVFVVGEAVLLAGHAASAWTANGDSALLQLVLAVGVVYPALLSVGALMVDELAFRRHARTKDVLIGVWASILEAVWFRPAEAGRRLHGTWQGIRGPGTREGVER